MDRSSIASVVLGPGHTAAAVLPLFLAGQADAEQVRSWAMTTTLDFENQAEIDAILQMVPTKSVSEIFAAQAKRSKLKAEKAGALRVTFSESGRIVLNGIRLNQSAEGKGGMPLCLYPAQLSTVIDSLPLMLQAVVDKAESAYSADEMDTVYNPAYETAVKVGRKAGKSDATIAAECKAAGIAKFVKQSHKRAGKTLIEWADCDRAAALAKYRATIESLRAGAAVK